MKSELNLATLITNLAVFCLNYCMLKSDNVWSVVKNSSELRRQAMCSMVVIIFLFTFLEQGPLFSNNIANTGIEFFIFFFFLLIIY